MQTQHRTSKGSKRMRIIESHRKDMPWILDLENGSSMHFFTDKALKELKSKIEHVLGLIDGENKNE